MILSVSFPFSSNFHTFIQDLFLIHNRCLHRLQRSTWGFSWKKAVFYLISLSCHDIKSSATSPVHTRARFPLVLFSLFFFFCILTVWCIIVSHPFRSSSTPFFSFSVVLQGHASLLMRCRGEWNNTIKRWWKRPEYFPPNLVSTAHSSQKASCLFLFSWQIIQSERGQAACDTVGSNAEKYVDSLTIPCPLCFLWSTVGHQSGVD